MKSSKVRFSKRNSLRMSDGRKKLMLPFESPTQIGPELIIFSAYRRLLPCEHMLRLTLKQSSLARQVFSELRDFLKSNASNGVLKTSDWEHKFEELEKKHQMPFERNASYEHCRGSVSMFRGYTCGLWTTFHTLTVQAYMSNQNNASFQPLPVLKAIQGWVEHFFGCRSCREHFMEMTTKTFPMETKVKKADDVFLYLWQAHNTVNARLKGDLTEDPEFPKYQFPAQFLCNNCSSRNDIFDDRAVTNFLFNYYTTIKPYDEQDNAATRVTLP
uniref:Sulfhydryl oxidase n=1 Tax=Plectus sambesii TaxID=2011161 RepID=A0A914WRT7_9BILA